MNEEIKCESCCKEPAKTIPVSRFIRRLDSYIAKNDLEGAETHILYWENEARLLGDRRGLLSVLSEKMGFYRKAAREENAVAAAEEALTLLTEQELGEGLSGAVILINAATTMEAFGRFDRALALYDRAAAVYETARREDSYEYAALLNNRSAALCELERYDEAEAGYNAAIDILKAEGAHDGEIALSLLGLAHLYFDRDDNAYEQVEATLDLSWEYLNSPRIPHDAAYAYTLTRCVPSYRRFRRDMEADALEAVAKEIYGA